MLKYNNLEGSVFGKLTVLSKEIIDNHTKWKCICECGNIKIDTASHLVGGYVKSCGCNRIEEMLKSSIKHGQSFSNKRTTEYIAWKAMKQRCYDSNSKSFHNYGGRGIKVCDSWLNSFENFFADMGKKPSKLYSLDRFPNKNGDYEKSNCRWATPKEQSRNTRSNIILEYNGISKIFIDWVTYFGIHKSTLERYLATHTFEEAYKRYSNR